MIKYLFLILLIPSLALGAGAGYVGGVPIANVGSCGGVAVANVGSFGGVDVAAVACATLQTPSETAASLGQFQDGHADTRTRLGTKFVYTGTNGKAICKVVIYAMFTGSSAHNYQVDIYSHDAGDDDPDASLGTSDVQDLSGIGGSETEVTFDFSTPTSALANGTTYWVVLASVSDAYDASNYASWFYNESGTTERVIEYDSTGAGWDTAYDTATFKYRLYSQ